MNGPGLSSPREHAPPVNNVEQQEQDGEDDEEGHVCPGEALNVLASSARTCLGLIMKILSGINSNVDNVISRNFKLIVEI